MRDIADTVEALEAAGRDFELHIAGRSPTGRPKTCSTTCNAAVGTSSYTGHWTARPSSASTTNLDLLLFPSRYRHEAAPMVVLEAASRSVPALAHPVGSLPELVCSADLIAPIGEFAGRADELGDREWMLRMG